MCKKWRIKRNKKIQGVDKIKLNKRNSCHSFAAGSVLLHSLFFFIPFFCVFSLEDPECFSAQEVYFAYFFFLFWFCHAFTYYFGLLLIPNADILEYLFPIENSNCQSNCSNFFFPFFFIINFYFIKSSSSPLKSISLFLLLLLYLLLLVLRILYVFVFLLPHFPFRSPFFYTQSDNAYINSFRCNSGHQPKDLCDSPKEFDFLISVYELNFFAFLNLLERRPYVEINIMYVRSDY